MRQPVEHRLQLDLQMPAHRLRERPREVARVALEELVEKMEHGEMSLEESLAAYERGVGLYRRCQSALEQAELRVRLLSDPGHPDNAEPFDGMPSPDA